MYLSLVHQVALGLMFLSTTCLAVVYLHDVTGMRKRAKSKVGQLTRVVVELFCFSGMFRTSCTVARWRLHGAAVGS